MFGNGPLLLRHKPFQMCKKSEHKLCFDKSASGDTWFAHSIEELVVWTVERHFGLYYTIAVYLSLLLWGIHVLCAANIKLIAVFLSPADVRFSRYIEVYHREHDPPDHSLFDDQTEQGMFNFVNSSDTGV